MKKKGPVTRMKESLQEKEGQVKDLQDKYLRTLAELDNYRKLMEKEKINYRRSSKVEFFKKIIPVLDSFDRALGGAELNHEFENFLKGVEIIQRQLREALKSMGLTEFSAVGEVFDPCRHEAVATIATGSHPDDMVIEEISKGYMVDNMVIKPAKVYVSKQKEGGQEHGENNRD